MEYATQNKSGLLVSGVSEKLQTAVCAGAPTMDSNMGNPGLGCVKAPVGGLCVA
ncbi:MAG: hypothetical protein AB7D06_18615 [Pedobacter sp.]